MFVTRVGESTYAVTHTDIQGTFEDCGECQSESSSSSSGGGYPETCSEYGNNCEHPYAFNPGMGSDCDEAITNFISVNGNKTCSELCDIYCLMGGEECGYICYEMGGEWEVNCCCDCNPLE